MARFRIQERKFKVDELSEMPIHVPTNTRQTGLHSNFHLLSSKSYEIHYTSTLQ